MPGEREESLTSVLIRDWGLSENASEADLLQALADRVAWMLRHDYERLLNALYLLDVPEAKLRAAKEKARIEESAEALSAVILEREHQKIKSRRQYRRNQSVDVRATDHRHG